ncbi:MAG: 5,10-methylenetetrahydrofolate reductase [Thermoplasmata archaeon]|nr:MAG: 5,10-methylenetetrahydrofolate reductase [Thermoplasmata archaeon]
MIITKRKQLDHILEKTKGSRVFIAGCSECATLSHTGGEKEVLEMKDYLEKNGVTVTGWAVLDPACHLPNTKRIFREKLVEDTDKILVLACGNGVQTVRDALPDKEVIAGLDSLFLGEIIHLSEFERRCNLCGECIVDEFNGICPIARCPKHMLNGPCGGSQNGRCEVNPEMECVWDRIYKRMIENGGRDQLRKIIPPKDWSKSLEMVIR